MSARFLGVVCGLQSEAAAVRACAGSTPIRVGVSGARAAQARAIAEGFCADGAAAILSVGVSGGLDPALRPGALIVAARVASQGGDLYDPAWADLTDAAIAPHTDQHSTHGDASDAARVLCVYGSDVIVASPEEKAALFARYGAAAVDMESHGAAVAAKVAGSPFIAIRAVADPAERAMPPAALTAVREDGATDLGAVVRSLLGAPTQLPALLRLGVDARAADQRMRTGLGGLLGRLALRLDLG
ncbi:MAG: hypothetical protein AAGC56_06105 [Pseudomonadota bacterium]